MRSRNIVSPAASVLFAICLGGCSGGGGGNTGTGSTVPPESTPAPTPGITLLAGALGGGAGGNDGISGRFDVPRGLAMDVAGNLYVADSANHTVRKITPVGEVVTLAGKVGAAGELDGAGSAARFNSPDSIAVDRAATVYVTGRNTTTIRRILPSGVVSTLAGVAGLSGVIDGVGTAARFQGPAGIAVDDAGSIYVTDACTIRKISPAGAVVTLSGIANACNSVVDGYASAARFYSPTGITVDHGGNIFVVQNEYWGKVRKLSPFGDVSTVGEVGGYIFTLRCCNAPFPSALSIDPMGSIYLGHTHAQSVMKMTPDGVNHVITTGGVGFKDGPASEAQFSYPSAAVSDPVGNLFVTDSGNNLIRKISPQGTVTTFAGKPPNTGYSDGTGPAVKFNAPRRLAVDRDGNVYVVDRDNYVVRRIDTAGVVTTFAGTAGKGGNAGTADGAPGIGNFYAPSGITIDKSGTLYVMDYLQRLTRISTGGAITTIIPAEFQTFPYTPIDYTIAIDGQGNTFVASTYNSGKGALGKIAPDGSTSFVSCDPPTEVNCTVRALAIDLAGNLLFVDARHTVRRLGANGQWTVIAGAVDESGAADGAGSTARFNTPQGIAVDSKGNIFVADTGNNLIRKIDTNGMVSTVAGTLGSREVKLGALPGSLNAPRDVVVDSNGALYVLTEDTVVKIQP